LAKSSFLVAEKAYLTVPPVLFTVKGVGRKISRGGGQQKRPKIAKKRKIALLGLF